MYPFFSSILCLSVARRSAERTRMPPEVIYVLDRIELVAILFVRLTISYALDLEQAQQVFKLLASE